ncbi:hypothetical protein VSS74_27910 [Conexibacter stalactiti]|uniref:Uncharacterized protein n=1 Tax=Conexibacter stalactiti TaxID=1940611 RepID=A0ABU4HYC3_9ACTN|nr:hypothetical protein [Conexibacter stalactiti]MDW5598215.1 hypothetical protein [Conexibacter stalactiti]MEC5038857.1 hypothetical protein [Conexibacter stalactiti]
MTIQTTHPNPEIVLLPELLEAYRHRAERCGDVCETEQEILAALHCRYHVKAEMVRWAGGPPRSAEDLIDQRGLARMIDTGAGTWLDGLDLELGTRDEMP